MLEPDLIIKPKNTKRLFWLRVLLVFLAGGGGTVYAAPSFDAFSAHAKDVSWSVTGVAYQEGSDQVLFQEYRASLRLASGQDALIVCYVDAQDQVMSVKRVEFTHHNLWQPNVYYYHLSSGLEAFSIRKRQIDSLQLTQRYRQNTPSLKTLMAGIFSPQAQWIEQQQRLLSESLTNVRDIQQAELVLEDQSVVDAGFDHWVTHHWQVINSPNGAEIRAVAVDAQQDFPFNLTAQTTADGAGQNLCRLHMRLAWWPLSWILSPVLLDYDCETKQLVRYQGLTNLKDKNNKRITADIHYQSHH